LQGMLPALSYVGIAGGVCIDGSPGGAFESSNLKDFELTSKILGTPGPEDGDGLLREKQI